MIDRKNYTQVKDLADHISSKCAEIFQIPYRYGGDEIKKLFAPENKLQKEWILRSVAAHANRNNPVYFKYIVEMSYILEKLGYFEESGTEI